MPAPTSSEIENQARGFLQSAGLRGENIPDLAGALGQLLGQSLSLFVSMAMVMPGIPASAPPPAGAGSTTGPGMLLPPPAGGPAHAQIEPLALAALSAKKLNGKGKAALAKVLARSIGQALRLFTTQVKVAPGLAITGLTTSAPGMLMGPAPARPMLQPIILAFARSEGLRGRNIPDLADALAELLAWALGQLVTRLQVSPGIASTPVATAAPGRLM